MVIRSSVDLSRGELPRLNTFSHVRCSLVPLKTQCRWEVCGDGSAAELGGVAFETCCFEALHQHGIPHDTLHTMSSHAAFVDSKCMSYGMINDLLGCRLVEVDQVYICLT